MKTRFDRYRQMAEILYRNGLGYLVSVAGLESWLPFRRREADGADSTRMASPEYLRRALEELGPTYVKLGQLLSTRPDLLPPAYMDELAKLQDSATPAAWDDVRGSLSGELGADPLEVFREFNSTPIASASIGQAYAAVLADGTNVVVKVRRPGIVPEVEADLSILQSLAGYASRHWEAARDYDVKGFMDEFADTLRKEMDYVQEGHNADRFALNFEDDSAVVIPRVYWEHTTSKVLTMERLYGMKVTDTTALEAAGLDRKALAVTAADAEMKMVFEDGFFHADPHPGNIFVQPNSQIGLIDFGMVGELDDKLRGQLSALFVAVIRKDPERMATALMRMTVSRTRPDRIKLRMDLAGLIKLYSNRTLGDAPVGRIITYGLGIIRNHHLQLPGEVALLLRMLIMTEGMGEVLDPDFSMGKTLAPYARRMTVQHLNPAAYAKRLGKAGGELLELGTELPGQLQRLINTLDFEGMEVHLRAGDLVPLVERLERVGNRMVAAIFAAAFIRGVGELTLGDADRWRGWQAPLMGAGLASTGVLGGYLAWSARRQRRLDAGQ